MKAICQTAPNPESEASNRGLAGLSPDGEFLAERPLRERGRSSGGTKKR
jgi:hypothetical protein